VRVVNRVVYDISSKPPAAFSFQSCPLLTWQRSRGWSSLAGIASRVRQSWNVCGRPAANRRAGIYRQCQRYQEDPALHQPL